MMHFQALVFLATCISIASAFHPFLPPWMSAETNVKVEVGTKRSIDDAFTFELRQRKPEVEEAPEVRLRSIIDRVTRKYESRAEARNQAAGIEERGTNIYPVVIANTPSQPQSLALHQDGTDFSYFATINFGAKSKPLYMLMDTGASSTWVMGSSCTTAACSKHNSFGAADSSTYKSTTTAFAINYGSGVVNGTYASDSINFAGMTLNMQFGSAAYTSDDFINFPMDGIMGLGLGKGNIPNLLETIVAGRSLKSNVFGVNINRNSDGLKDGAINFGAPDTSKYTGSLGYTAVSKTGNDWVIPADDIGFKASKSGVTGRVAYIDTGTSFIFIPAEDAKKLYANIPGAVLGADNISYTVPCTTTDPVQFWFSGVAYNVAARDWVSAPNNGVCTSNIYARSVVGDGAWLLGDTFLKNVYTVFDVDQTRIGFGAKPLPSVTTTGSSAPQTSSSSAPVVPNTMTAPSSTTATSSSSAGSTRSNVPSSTVSSSQTPNSVSSGSSSASTTSTPGGIPLINGGPGSTGSTTPGSSSSSSPSETASSTPAQGVASGSSINTIVVLTAIVASIFFPLV